MARDQRSKVNKAVWLVNISSITLEALAIELGNDAKSSYSECERFPKKIAR
jgi:hypothetical protein